MRPDVERLLGAACGLGGSAIHSARGILRHAGKRRNGRADCQAETRRETDKMKKISVLIPCYNEKENVGPISQAVTGILERGASPV